MAGNDNCYVPFRRITEQRDETVIAHFVRRLRTGEQPVQSAKRHVHEILFGAYQSAETGGRYALTTTFTPVVKLDPHIWDTRSRFI